VSLGVLVGKYAKSFGRSLGYEDRACQQVRSLSEHLREFYLLSNVKEIFSSQAVPLALKEDLLEYALLKFPQSKDLEKSIRVLRGAGRFFLLPRVLQEYLLQADSHAGVVDAKVSSAVKLNSKQELSLKLVLEKIFKKKIRLHLTQETSLLGGFVVRVGEKVFDLSLHKKIERLTTQVMA
jgi:F-type H+-transporting ATPase subunit delta